MPNTAVKLFSANGSWGLPPARVGRCQADKAHSNRDVLFSMHKENAQAVKSSGPIGAAAAKDQLLKKNLVRDIIEKAS